MKCMLGIVQLLKSCSAYESGFYSWLLSLRLCNQYAHDCGVSGRQYGILLHRLFFLESTKPLHSLHTVAAAELANEKCNRMCHIFTCRVTYLEKLIWVKTNLKASTNDNFKTLSFVETIHQNMSTAMAICKSIATVVHYQTHPRLWTCLYSWLATPRGRQSQY